MSPARKKTPPPVPEAVGLGAPETSERETGFDLLRTRLQAGLNIIEADAGTGKTWTLAHLVPRLLISGQVERLDQLLLVSFTEDATRELAGRVRATLADLLNSLLELHPRPDQCEDLGRLLEGARAAAEAGKQGGRAVLLQALLELPEPDQRVRVRSLLAARLDADRLVVATIHSLCKRVLDDEGFLCGMPSGFSVATRNFETRARALRDVWRQDLAPDPLLSALRQGWGGKEADWSLDGDAKAWSLLQSMDSEALHPRPLSLEKAKANCVEALNVLRGMSQELSSLERLVHAPGVSLNTAGKHLDFEQLAALWPGLAPDAPAPDALQAAQSLAEWDDWVRKDKAPANQAARAALALHPLTRAAEAFGRACADLAWAWRGHALKAARLRLDKELRQANQVSFNDLIERLERALHGPQGEELARRLRKRWKLALVDESQDTDRRQLAIFEAIFNRPGELDCSLTLIGDPKQSIYAFRGADLDAYEQIRARTGVQLCRLSKAQRPAAGLVRALNRLFARAAPAPLASPGLLVPEAVPARGEDELPLPQGKEQRLVVALASPEDARAWTNGEGRYSAAAEAAAQDLAHLLGRPVLREDGSLAQVEPGSCALLVRDRHQARALRQALDARGIPSVLRDNGDVFDGAVAAELRTVLAAVLRPGRGGLHRDALATRLLGFDAADLETLDGPEEDAWLERFRAWRDIWDKRGIAALLERLDQEAGMGLNLAGLPDGERLLTDLHHLEELLAVEEAEQSLSPEHLLRRFDACVDESGGGDQPLDTRLRRLETDTAAAQILTVHSAKGLEFDYCFLPFLWYSKPPKPTAPRIVRLDKGMAALADPARLEADEADRVQEQSCLRTLEEELRLAYVALTRAKRRIWLLAGWIGYGPGYAAEEPSALDWLLRKPQSGESFPDWYRRLTKHKKAELPEEQGGEDDNEEPACEHEAGLRALEAQGPDLIAVLPLNAGTETASAWAGVSSASQDLAPESAPALPPSWRFTSFSALAGSNAGLRGHRDPDRSDGSDAGAPLALTPFPGGTRAGECLHEILEQWDFRGVPTKLEETLKEHSLALTLPNGQTSQALLAAELPRWAGALVPGLGSLAETASNPGLSEWHFVLPLDSKGLDGPRLAGIFRTHPDPRVRAYADSLESLAETSIHGMMQGYLDRLLRQGNTWAVADWKSNRLGDYAEDFREERLFEEAASHHYILQVYLYLVALRRHLRARGGSFHLDGGSLVFVRALEPGSSRGILRFAADETFLDRLDALFLRRV